MPFCFARACYIEIESSEKWKRKLIFKEAALFTKNIFSSGILLEGWKNKCYLRTETACKQMKVFIANPDNKSESEVKQDDEDFSDGNRICRTSHWCMSGRDRS